jgi:hypothetical protein
LHNLAVIDGVDAGERIVLTNLDVLFTGARVRLSVTRTLAQELRRQRSRSAKLVDEDTSPNHQAP